MKNYIQPALIWTCVLATVVAFFALHNTVLALILATAGFLLWVVPGLFQTTEPVEVTEPLDPAEIKEYRRQHPGTSIRDAIRALQSER